MPDSGNGKRVLDLIEKGLDRLDKKLDKVIECAARNDERLNMHGRALRWLFGLVASGIMSLVAYAIFKGG